MSEETKNAAVCISKLEAAASAKATLSKLQIAAVVHLEVPNERTANVLLREADSHATALKQWANTQ